VAVQDAAPKKGAYNRGDQSAVLVDLCSECPYPDCIGGEKTGCKEYQKAQEALRNGEEYHPPENWGAQQGESEITDPDVLFDLAWRKMGEEPAISIDKQQPDSNAAALTKLNDAIRALMEISDRFDLLEPIMHLREIRIEQFEYLGDWDSVAWNASLGGGAK